LDEVAGELEADVLLRSRTPLEGAQASVAS